MRIPNEKGEFGRYDEDCEAIAVEHQARAVLLFVITQDGKDGFSVSARDPQIVQQLPLLLRALADSIEAQIKQTKGN